MFGMKRITHTGAFITVFIIITLLFSTVSAVNDSEADAYTYETLKEIALADNMQTKVDQLYIKTKQTALEDALEKARTLGDAYGKSAVLNNRITREVRPFEAETALEAAKMTLNDNLNSLELNIYNIYMKILLARKELEKENALLELWKEKYTLVSAKYDMGLVTADEQNSIQYNIDSKQVQISSINQKLLSFDLELKLLLNIPFDAEPLNIAGTLEKEALSIPDIEQMLEDAFSTDTGLYRKKRALEAKEMTMELVTELYSPGDSYYDDNNLALETAQMEYSAEEANVEIDIRNKYNSFLNKTDSLELAKAYEDLMKSKLDNAGIRYENGLISKEEYLSEKERYLQAVYATFSAIYDFNTTAMGIIK